MRRTGRVGADLWRRLVRADVPRAFSPSGTHIEVSKTKQVMYEVVRGKVAKVIHVSTGATGNTPVGKLARLPPRAGREPEPHVLLALLPPRLRDPRLQVGPALAGEPRVRADAALVRAAASTRAGAGSAPASWSSA